MVNGKVIVCLVLVAAWCEVQSASLPFLPSRVGSPNGMLEVMHPAVLRGKVREGVPPPLCAERCTAPRTGPVCAFDAAGTARTFTSLCELEAVSCRESTFVSVNGLIAKSLDQHLKRLSLDTWIKGRMQKAVILDTARIVRRFLTLQP